MTERRLQGVRYALLALGAAARLVAWTAEPAWSPLSGMGVVAWEWRDGILLRLHWALASLILVEAGWWGGGVLARRLHRAAGYDAPWASRRGGEEAPAGWEGSVLGGLLLGLFVPLVTFSVHTLSEVPAMLFLAWAFVATSEACDEEPDRWSWRAPAIIGALLACGVAMRLSWAPIALVPPLMFLANLRPRALAWMALGALPPVALFGLVDRLTWDEYFGSFLRYVHFNFVESTAADFGVEGPLYYVEQLRDDLPLGLPLLLVGALAGVRVSWPYVLTAMGTLAYLSTQAHKDERFIVVIWPLLLIGAAGALGGRIAMARARLRAGTRGRWAPWQARAWAWASLASVLVVLGDGFDRYRTSDARRHHKESLDFAASRAGSLPVSRSGEQVVLRRTTSR